MKNTDSNRGRPAKDRDKIIERLRPFIVDQGQSVKSACLLAKVSYTSVNNWRKEDDDFNNELEGLSNLHKIMLEETLIREVKSNEQGKAIETAKWLLERKHKQEYSLRVENQIEGGSFAINLNTNLEL